MNSARNIFLTYARLVFREVVTPEWFLIRRYPSTAKVFSQSKQEKLKGFELKSIAHLLLMLLLAHYLSRNGNRWPALQRGRGFYSPLPVHVYHTAAFQPSRSFVAYRDPSIPPYLKVSASADQPRRSDYSTCVFTHLR